jgi:hypothetical protein
MRGAGVHAAGATYGAGLLLFQRQLAPAAQDGRRCRLLALEGGRPFPAHLLAPGAALAGGLTQLPAS